MPTNYTARQPIFDLALNTWGYELLYRSGVENQYTGARDTLSMDNATLSVLEKTLVNHLTDLCGSKKKLINFTKNLIIGEFAYLLPKESVIIELLEDIQIDDEVVEACKNLKRAGYTIALDDFVYSNDYLELLKYVDIVKLDFMYTDIDTRKDIIEKLKDFKIDFLAEKVETYEDYEDAKKLGCIYFQGYFFSKPHMVKNDPIYESKLSKQKLISEVNSSDFVLENIEDVFKSDPVLTLRLFKFLNSSFFSFDNEISSLKQAIVLLGEKTLKRWITVVATADLSEDKPLELIRNSIMRATFCESLAQEAKTDIDTDDFFFLGLFSNIEAFFDIEKETLLNDLPMSKEVKEVLLEKAYTGERFYILAITRFLERGNWDTADHFAELCGLEIPRVQELYTHSVILTNKIMEEFHF